MELTSSAVGHGGVDIAQKRGTEVRLVALEHQVGEAEVLYVGKLFGNSVVTRHALREAGKLRDYLVIHGHLDGPAPGLASGQNAREGTLVGFVGDSGSPGDVHLHLEIRRVRDGIDAKKLAPAIWFRTRKPSPAIRETCSDFATVDADRIYFCAVPTKKISELC